MVNKDIISQDSRLTSNLIISYATESLERQLDCIAATPETMWDLPATARCCAEGSQRYTGTD